MDSLVERLREKAREIYGKTRYTNMYDSAAARIEYLEAELQKAREAALEEAATEVDLIVRKLGHMPNCTYLCAAIRSLSQKEG